MRKNLLVAGIAAAALIPSFAFAQQTCEQQHSQRVVGTVAGAGIGALLGSAIAGKGDRTTGAVIGALGGGLVGNQVTKGQADCAHAYGYYDTNGAWHANAVSQADAQGYYARDGQWVAGAPNGYYDGQGRWITASTNASASGYYDRQGRWVPASSNGYYDTNGQWVAGAASGYYSNGRWVAGPATGHYDANGRWLSGQASGSRDARGVWIADAQPGYYDSRGRWVAGPAVGYYDTQGRWIATAPSAQSYGSNASYGANSMWNGAPTDVRAREAWLDQRIRAGMNDGSLRRDQANAALRTLSQIRRDEQALSNRRGGLRNADAQRIQARLDDLNDGLDWRRDNRRSY